MILVGITLFLILIGLGFFAYGAIALSKYAFRLGTGTGLMTLLFPPYTIYFALFKLEEDGKSWPTASWVFGLVVAVLLSIAFYPDLSALARGDMERFQGPIGAGEAAVEKYGSNYQEEEASDDSASAKEAEEAGDSEAAGEETAEAGEAEGGEAEAAAAEDAEPAAGEKADGEQAAGKETAETAGN